MTLLVASWMPGPYGFFLDPSYLILILPALLLVLWAQNRITRVFEHYSRVPARSGHTGQTAARLVLSRYGLQGVRVERTPGHLTDHYDPKNQVLRLSDATCDSPSIAAIGVACHEAGHAVQHQEAYWPNQLRTALVPLAQIGSSIGPYVILIGFIFSSFLTNIGIILFSASVLFYLVTLPVELDASRRALRVIEEQGLLTDQELPGARRVLRAAAMTYVASAFMAFMSLARLIFLARGRNDRSR